MSTTAKPCDSCGRNSDTTGPHHEYFARVHIDHYHDWRTHLSLSMDAPNPRVVHPPDRDKVVAFSEVGGLHHHYERLAA